MCGKQEGRPQNRRSHGEVVIEMACARAKLLARQTVRIHPGFTKAVVRELIIMEKIEAMLDQRRTRVGVIADAIPADPRVDQGKREEKNGKKQALTKLRVNWGVEKQSNYFPLFARVAIKGRYTGPVFAVW